MSEWEIEIEEIIAVLELKKESTIRERILHSIISGPLDCDKIDYIRRDSTHLGVLFGAAVDEERLLRNLTVVYASRPKEDGHGSALDIAEIGVTAKALVIANSVVQARNEMFTQVYWQHTVRALKAMLAYAVRRILISISAEHSAEFWARFHDHVFSLQPCYNIVMPKSSLEASRPNNCEELAADFEGEPSSYLGMSTHLSPTDDALLMFLSQYGDSKAQAMLNAIRQRQLYRRVAVLSGESSAEPYSDEHKYKTIYDRFRTYRLDKNYSELEKLRNHWEDGIVSKLKAKLEANAQLLGGKTMTEIGDELRRIDPLVLIDVPIKATRRRVGRSSALHYLEEDPAAMHGRTQSFSPPRFEVARLDLDQEAFDRYVGKIRVFVHPGFRDIFASTLSRTEMIDVLSA
jgi:HD superfamily phosphohydrolase